MALRRLGILLFIACVLVGCSEKVPTVIAGESMGTRYHITLVDSGPDYEAIDLEMAALLKEIEDQASQWREDSWVSRFNASESLEPVAVPDHVWAMLLVAERVHEESGGLLDITVGPLVELWGFGHEPSADPPSEMQIAVTLARCGMDKLVLDHDAQTVRKTQPAVEIDLSSLAKGYAIDRIDDLLGDAGLENYLIEFGGEVLPRSNDVHRTWKVAIHHSDGMQTQVNVNGFCYATSGGSEQQRELGDGVVTHLIDPRTGRATTDAMRTVTVGVPVTVEGCTMLADAWATALSVASPEEAEQLAERFELIYMD